MQPAAKRVNFAQAVSRWFKQKFSTEDLSEDNIWADNAPERPVKFDPTNHRKYNSQVPATRHACVSGLLNYIAR